MKNPAKCIPTPNNSTGKIPYHGHANPNIHNPKNTTTTTTAKFRTGVHRSAIRRDNVGKKIPNIAIADPITPKLASGNPITR